MKIFNQYHRSKRFCRIYKQGFTLIEMLVVISVVGILVTLAGYNHTRVLKNARDTSLKREIDVIRTAVYRFSLDNSGRFPESLQELVGDELRQVPVQWKGSKGSGIYHYEAETGTISLFDQQNQTLSSDVDQAGVVYGSY